MSERQTVGELRRAIATALMPVTRSASLDARLLVAHAMGIAPDDVILNEDQPVGSAVAIEVHALAKRRAAGEPVARIVGEKEFYGLPMMLSAATLVPRPDTEALVDAVLEVVHRESTLAILDLGTGSGAILLALLSQLPNAAGLGVDRAPEALSVAERNARRLGFAERALFAEGDWAAGIRTRFDVVVSNPPYIATAEIAELPVEVRDFDPHLALDGGDDGLESIRAVLSNLDSVLAPEGVAFVEIGHGQADAVGDIAAANGYKSIFRADLGGVPRVAVLSRKIEASETVS